jgi:beta-lactamase superfamily II metal-dependent hydrolase
LIDRELPPTVTLQRVAAGDRWGDAEVLHPPGNFRVTRADEGVMALRLHWPGCRILFLSDLNLAGQRALLDGASVDDLRADVVVAGLPDTGEPLIPDLLSAVQPRLVIVADDERPPQRRAPDVLLERLEAAAPVVLSTRQVGAIKVNTHRRGWVATDPHGGVLARGAPRAPPADVVLGKNQD